MQRTVIEITCEISRNKEESRVVHSLRKNFRRFERNSMDLNPWKVQVVIQHVGNNCRINEILCSLHWRLNLEKLFYEILSRKVFWVHNLSCTLDRGAKNWVSINVIRMLISFRYLHPGDKVSRDLSFPKGPSMSLHQTIWFKSTIYNS